MPFLILTPIIIIENNIPLKDVEKDLEKEVEKDIEKELEKDVASVQLQLNLIRSTATKPHQINCN
jgi:hypothetical protein